MVWLKHRAYWRRESCVGACYGVIETPCLLEARVTLLTLSMNIVTNRSNDYGRTHIYISSLTEHLNSVKTPCLLEATVMHRSM